MKKIDPRILNEREAFDYHDWLREGRQVELSPWKVAALLKKLVFTVNTIVDELEKKKN